MKKFLSLIAIALAAIGMNAQNIIPVNSTVTSSIVISAAGEYTLQGNGSECKVGITVNADLGAVTLIADNINVYPGSAAAGILVNAGSTLTLKLKGDNILKGKTDNSGLEVWGNVIIESFDGSNTPTLTTTGSYAPGIGVNKSGKTGGDITINSGTIKAIGASKAAGIGNGTNKGATKVGNITINGGIVDASTTSTSHAAGIGAGYYIDGTSKNKPEYLNYASITINGGIVTAKGYGEASAIGCSKYTNGGNITINGGTVTPTSTNDSYRGLGGAAFTGKVIITGGSVNSKVKPDAAAVNGSSEAVKMNTFTTEAGAHVTGGTITGTGLNYTLGTDYGSKDIYADASGKVYFWLPSSVTDATAALQTTVLDLNQPINITSADTYKLIGTGAETTNGINVAGGLGEVVLEVKNVNINATTALQIGAGTTVIINAGNAQLTGAVAGDGKLVINGGTHIFKGTKTLAAVEINGGSVKTLTAAGALQGWTGVKNAAGTDLAMFEAVHTVADTKIINGSITGTDYEFNLKTENYGLDDVKTDAEGKFYPYIKAPIAGDAVGLFNQLIEIDLTAAGSNDVIIDAAGKYQLNGSKTRTTGRVIVNADLGNVYLNLNQVDIKASKGAGIMINSGTTVYLTLTDSNSVKAGATYYSGIVAEGNLVVDGPGILYAEGSTGSAIGCKHEGTKVGNITINGGFIYAKGSTYGAGIGMAYVGKNPNKSIVRINGGTIIATAGTGNRAIGKADSGDDMKVQVAGGNIRCLNASKAEIAMTNFTDTAGGALAQFISKVPGAKERKRVYGGYVGTIQLGTDYGMNDVYTLKNASNEEGNVYFYLPAQEAGVEVYLDTHEESTLIDLTKPINITKANTYQLYGTGAQTTNGINVAGDLGDVVLEVKDVNINATTVLQIGAGTTVTIDAGNTQLTGAFTGGGELVINGGMHIFKGEKTLTSVEINGGSVKTLTAAGALQGWTGVKNAADEDVALFEGTHTEADVKIINGIVTGTDYEFDLKAESYGLTDVKSDAAGKVYLYITAPVATDAVGVFNQEEVIAASDNDFIISVAGKYRLDGIGKQTKGRVIVNGDLGKVYLKLNKVDIKASAGAGIMINAGTTVYLSLTDSNSVKAGATYYSGIVAEGDLVIDGPGILYAEGSTSSGIGCVHQGSKVGNITINGGIIYARGGTYGAGIGMAYVGQNPNNSIIRINGGTIIARAGTGTRAIGKADSGSDMKVKVAGGNIRCLNSSGAEIAMTNFTDTAGGALVQLIARVANATERKRVYGGFVGEIELGVDYGMNDVYTLKNASSEEGYVYFYLPAQEEGVLIILDTHEESTLIDLTKPINITKANTYQLIGTGDETTNGINVAGDLGEVVLEMKDVNINATTVLNIGAGTTVIINAGNSQLTGTVAGGGKLVINGGMHTFKGEKTLAAVEINGGSVKTLDANGALQGWTGVKNADDEALALFEGTHTEANVKINNGSVTGTGYEFDLMAEGYGLSGVMSDDAGKVYLYIKAPVPADAVGVFNQLYIIKTSDNDIIIDAAGKYRLDGIGKQTKGRVIVNGDLGEVYLNLNKVNILATAGAGIMINAGTTVYLTLTESNSVKAGATYNSGIVAEGDLVIDGPGSLYAEGSTSSGIGGKHQGAKVGNITINGGIIEAKGGTYGAGIGMAYVGANPTNSIILINGGTIIARAGAGDRAIGKTDTGSDMKVKVAGGNIRCLNASGAEIAMANFTDTAGTALKQLIAKVAGITERERVYGGQVGDIQLGTDYGMNDVYTLKNASGEEGYVYLYLPQQVASVEVALLAVKYPSYTRNVTLGNYGTICLPYQFTSMEGVEALYVPYKKTAEVLYCEEITLSDVVAGGAYIFKSDSDAVVFNMEGEPVMEAVEANYMKGWLNDAYTLLAADFESGAYFYGCSFLSGNKVRQPEAESQILKNRGMINMNDVPMKAAAPARGRLIAFGVNAANTPTGMVDVNANVNANGKVIRNGQLFIIRDGRMFNALGQEL